MTRALAVLVLVTGGALLAQDPAGETPVFRSDVSLVRVDVQVLDRSNRAVTGLTVNDFILRDNGQIQPIRQFQAEEAPVDILFLIDVSGSMRPHVEAVARASRQAINVLGPDDRVALMVFDRRSKLRMPFRKDSDSLLGAFDDLLRQESFDGGTDITRGMYDAVSYVANNARKDARRAIVILTDDRTQRDRDEAGVLSALARANTVMSLLLTPDAMQNQYPGGYPRGGGIGVPSLGDIIFGRRGPTGGGGSRYPGGGYPGGGGAGGMGGLQSAGTPEIARQSGGDSLNINDGGALELTLSRLRQRYALYFQVPPGARAGQTRNIQVSLANYAAGRYPGADLRYRPTYNSSSDIPGDISSTTSPSDQQVGGFPTAPPQSADPDARPTMRRRPAVDRTGSAPAGPNPSVGAPAAEGGWKRAENTTPASPSATAPPPAATPTPVKVEQKEPEKVGGWPKATPEQMGQTAPQPSKPAPAKTPFFPQS